MMKRFKYALLAGAFVVASVVAPTFGSDAAAAGKWVKDSKGYWYIKKGMVDFTYNGTVTYNNKKYAIKNGKVV